MGKFLSLRAQRGNLLHYNQQVKDCRVAIAPRNDQLIRDSLDIRPRKLEASVCYAG